MINICFLNLILIKYLTRLNLYYTDNKTFKMITYQNITLEFGKKHIFHKFNLKIQRGDKIILQGKSGTGKSSILALLLGFKQPQKGRIIFNNMTVNPQNIWAVRQQIAYVDQDVSLGDTTVQEFIQIVQAFKANQLAKFHTDQQNKLLSFFELSDDILKKSMVNISGGERQRIAFIISILLNRSVFLLDEVTSSLDKELKNKVVDYFMGLKEQTVISISHDNLWLNHPKAKIFNMDKKQWK